MNILSSFQVPKRSTRSSKRDHDEEGNDKLTFPTTFSDVRKNANNPPTEQKFLRDQIRDHGYNVSEN